MIYEVPTQQGIPFWKQRTKISGREYNLRFLWNQRMGRWSLDFHDGNDDPIVSGLRLVPFVALFAAYRYDDRLPPGELIVFTALADQSPPGLNDLGKRCKLLYADTSDEIATLTGANAV